MTDRVWSAIGWMLLIVAVVAVIVAVVAVILASLDAAPSIGIPTVVR